MQYKLKNETVAMIITRDIFVETPLSLVEYPQIRRTRKTLMVILDAFLGFNLTILLYGIFLSNILTDIMNISTGAMTGEAVISILFYAFGILVAYRYSQIGLRIFLWLTVIKLVAMGIILAFLLVIAILRILSVIHIDHRQNKDRIVEGIMVLFPFIGIDIALFLLLVIILKFTLKLKRLIDANKRFPIQQI